MADAVVEDYTTSLEDLKFNSKPHINALTMLAEENSHHADLIVHIIEAKLNKAPSNEKLPLMYLMDSIVKNVGGNYTPLFAKNIVKTFFTTFDSGDEKTKIALHKLRFTWDNYFPLKKLYELDMTIHNIDSNWPVKPLPVSLQDKPSTSIHVNPKFLKKTDPVPPVSKAASTVKSPVGVKDSVDLKQDLINKQKQLLDLQQQKLLLELEQTKQQLALRERRNQIAAKKQVEPPLKDPRVKQTSAIPASLRVTVPNGQKQQLSARAPPKDPRENPVVRKQPPPVSVKKVPTGLDPRNKSDVQKTPPDVSKTKTAVKKSPTAETSKKKKQSPNNSTKNLKSAKTVSPKNSTKSDGGKKMKAIKKKNDGKTSTNSGKEKDEQRTQDNAKKDPSKRSMERDVPKKRERPGRRSPARNQAPPAKQPRRSTSMERRRSPSPPPRRNTDFERKIPQRQRNVAIREEEHFQRGSPRSAEGSLSPRFSPEPDEPTDRRQNWRPTVKRQRQPGGQPQVWQHEENMPPRNIPPMRRRSSVDPNLQIPQELTLSHQAEILKQAEIQLHTGQLTHVQHQELLKQLHQLFELQRLRNSQQHIERPAMPLDELLPQQHEEHGLDRNLHNFLDRRGENHPSAFRPPPSPPRMDNEHGRKGFPHPSHRLSPPPMPPTDPRMGRHHHSRNEDPRFHNHIENRPPQQFRNNHERHFAEVDERSRRDHVPPIRRRGSGNWEAPHHAYGQRGDSPVVEEPFYSMSQDPHLSHPQRRDFQPISQSSNREDHGFFVVKDDSQQQTRKEPLLPLPKDISHTLPRKGSQERLHGRRENSDLQNGEKPNPERVPLRSYAHPDKMEDTKSTTKRRHSHGESDRPKVQRSPPRSRDEKPKRRDRRSPPKNREERNKPRSDDEDNAPRLEEPEDYIIANIPPEAEVYHKHSMKLKKSQTEAERAYREHKKNILLSTYTKKIASENSSDSKQEDSDEVMMKSKEMDVDQTNLALSPDVSKRDKIEEEVNKSPSLPLKKRKYHMSSSNDPKDSSDGGGMSELEAEAADGLDKKDDIVDEEKRELEPETDETVMDAEEHTETAPTPKDLDHENTEGNDVDIKEEAKEEMSDDTPKAPNEPKNSKESKTEEPLKSESDKPSRRRSKEKHHVDREKGRSERKERKNLKQRVNEVKAKPMHRSASEGRMVSRRQLHDEIMKEEEDMFRLRMELEKGLEQEEFERMQERDGPGRGGPMRRGWGRGRGDNGPWNRGRGRFGKDRRGRRWEREEDRPDDYPSLMDDPHFPGRRPRGDRHLPPGPIVDDRDWLGRPDMNRDGPHPFDRPWNERDMRGPPFEDNGRPIRRPMPGRHGERMLPPPPNNEMEMGRFRGPAKDGPDRFGPPPQTGPEFNQVNVNKLLSDLLNMGIIPGPGNSSKPPEVENPRSTSPATNEKPVSTPPLTDNTIDEPIKPEAAKETLSNLFNKSVAAVEKDTKRVPTPVFEDLLTLDPDANLPEITFDDMDKLKIRCDELIKRIYTGIQCSTCGMRFTACQTDMYAEHLDWHYRLNRKDKDGVKDTHRQLYPTAGDWIMYEEIVDPSKRAHNEVFDEAEAQDEEQMDAAAQGDPEDLVVPVAQHPDQDKCNVCNEAFKTVYNDEEEEWQYVNCVAVEGKNFHPACYADHNDQHDPIPLPTPVRVPLYNPIESSLKGIPGLDTLIQQDSESEENMEETYQLSKEVSEQAEDEQTKKSENETLPRDGGDPANTDIDANEVEDTENNKAGKDSSIAEEDVAKDEAQENYEDNEDSTNTIEQLEPSNETPISMADSQHEEPVETSMKMEVTESDFAITSGVDIDGATAEECAPQTIKGESQNEPFVQIASSSSQNINDESSELAGSPPNVCNEKFSDAAEVRDSNAIKNETRVDVKLASSEASDVESPAVKAENCTNAVPQNFALPEEAFSADSSQPPPPGTAGYEEGDEMGSLESESDSEEDISVEI